MKSKNLEKMTLFVLKTPLIAKNYSLEIDVI